MGKASGFMEHSRETATRRPVTERVNDWFEIYQDFPEEKLRTQGTPQSMQRAPWSRRRCVSR